MLLIHKATEGAQSVYGKSVLKLQIRAFDSASVSTSASEETGAEIADTAVPGSPASDP